MFNQRGFSLFGIFFLVAVVVVGGTAFYFASRQKSSGKKLVGVTKQSREQCDLKPKPREFSLAPYYSGPLVDAHVHMPIASRIVATVAKQFGFEDMPVLEGELSPQNLFCLFESEGIKQTIGFHMLSKFSPSTGHIEQMAKNYPGKFAHFYLPPPIHELLISPAETEAIITQPQGLFRGIGEISFEKGTFTRASPFDQPFSDLIEIARKHKLVVMIHPAASHQDEIKKLATQFPDVTFLLHGGQEQEWIAGLLASHRNLYYSLDANMTSLYGFERRHDSEPITKEQWLAFIRQNFDKKVQEATSKWKAKIEANPDQYVWGTDRWYGWQFDYEVGGLLEEFARSLVGKLDPAVQQKFAYQNAERLLGQ